MVNIFKIIDKRNSGKTSRLMLIAKDRGAIFVCRNVNAMRQKANAYGITGITFVSYNDFIDDNMPDGNTPVVIDEVDDLLNHLCRNPILGYNLSED